MIRFQTLSNNITRIDVDRSALAAAKVYGIMDDLHMSTNDFATAISILFGEGHLWTCHVLQLSNIIQPVIFHSRSLRTCSWPEFLVPVYVSYYMPILYRESSLILQRYLQCSRHLGLRECLYSRRQILPWPPGSSCHVRCYRSRLFPWCHLLHECLVYQERIG